MIPKDLRYTESHEWARVDEASGVVTVGITRFAVEQLGDIVYLELPAVGAQVSKDQPFGAIESVKAAVDINAPVSGEVTEANASAADELDIVAAEPYGGGWMIKIRPSDPAELSSLMEAAAYQKHVEGAKGEH